MDQIDWCGGGIAIAMVKRGVLLVVLLGGMSACSGTEDFFRRLSPTVPPVSQARESGVEGVVLNGAHYGSFFEHGRFGASNSTVVRSGVAERVTITGALYPSASGEICRPISIGLGRVRRETVACRVSDRGWRIYDPLTR